MEYTGVLGSDRDKLLHVTPLFCDLKTLVPSRYPEMVIQISVLTAGLTAMALMYVLLLIGTENKFHVGVLSNGLKQTQKLFPFEIYRLVEPSAAAPMAMEGHNEFKTFPLAVGPILVQ